MCRSQWLAPLIFFLVVQCAAAINVEELITKNIQVRGGLEKIRAIQTLRMTGKVRFGSIDVPYVFMAKRSGKMRSELSLQGMTAIRAYNGMEGWRISPFQGRIDPEKLSADDTKQMKINADIDGPLVDYQSKGNRIEYLGTEDVDGTDAHKLKVTFKTGDIRYIYLDPDYFLEIRNIDVVRIRGAEQVTETDLGNYEQIDGVYFPFSDESGEPGQPKDASVTIEKAEANVELDDSLFQFPTSKK